MIQPCYGRFSINNKLPTFPLYNNRTTDKAPRKRNKLNTESHREREKKSPLSFIAQLPIQRAFPSNRYNSTGIIRTMRDKWNKKSSRRRQHRARETRNETERGRVGWDEEGMHALRAMQRESELALCTFARLQGNLRAAPKALDTRETASVIAAMMRVRQLLINIFYPRARCCASERPIPRRAAYIIERWLKNFALKTEWSARNL